MEGFTVALALVDAIPVLFFGGSMLVISSIFDSTLFMIGAIVAVVGGLCQVTWKLILGWKKVNVPVLHLAFAPLLAGGGILMMLGLVLDHEKLNFPGMWAAVRSMPSLVLFIIGILALGLMVYFSKHMDQTSAKANWTEQITNAVAQGCIFFALLAIALK